MKNKRKLTNRESNLNNAYQLHQQSDTQREQAPLLGQVTLSDEQVSALLTQFNVEILTKSKTSIVEILLTVQYRIGQYRIAKKNMADKGNIEVDYYAK